MAKSSLIFLCFLVTNAVFSGARTLMTHLIAPLDHSDTSAKTDLEHPVGPHRLISKYLIPPAAQSALPVAG